jgi:hypothetical protein
MEKDDESGRPFVGLALLALIINTTDNGYERLESAIDLISKCESRICRQEPHLT